MPVVTPAEVRAIIAASSTSVTDEKIQYEIEIATMLVNKYIGGPDDGTEPIPLPVPAFIHHKAVLLVTVEQINQAKAPNGVLNQTFDVGVGDIASTPARIGRDPLKPAYPILDRWTIPMGFA